MVHYLFVTSSSQVRASAMLLLLIVGNGNYAVEVAANGVTFLQNFVKIGPVV
jgi:hypothetical protein